MGKKADPVASINQIFQEDSRRVPYPVFMRCFDALMKEPGGTEPEEPSADLKETFRAVCLAIDVGIADRQQRDEDRIEEFYEHIYPVWKEALPESEFQAYQQILDGQVGERMRQRRREEQKKCAEEARKRREKEMDPEFRGEAHARFEQLTAAAMKQLGEEEEAPAETEASSEVGGTASAGEKTPASPAPEDAEPAVSEAEETPETPPESGDDNVPVARSRVR